MEAVAASNPDPWLFGVIGTGVASIGAMLACVFARRRPRPTLSEVLTMFLTCSGAAGGFKLCWFTVFDPTFVHADIDRSTIFVGGLALIWFGLDALADAFKRQKSLAAASSPAARDMPSSPKS
jgi:hypothetical protein